MRKHASSRRAPRLVTAGPPAPPPSTLGGAGTHAPSLARTQGLGRDALALSLVNRSGPATTKGGGGIRHVPCSSPTSADSEQLPRTGACRHSSAVRSSDLPGGVNVAGHCIAGNFFATGSTTPAHLATGHPHCWRTRTVLALLNKDYPTGAWGGAPRGHHSPTPRNVSVGHHSLAQIAARMALIGRLGIATLQRTQHLCIHPTTHIDWDTDPRPRNWHSAAALLLPGRRAKQQGSIPLGSVIHPP